MEPNIKIPMNEFRMLSNSQDFPQKHNAYTILPEVHFAFFQKFLQNIFQSTTVPLCHSRTVLSEHK